MDQYWLDYQFLALTCIYLPCVATFFLDIASRPLPICLYYTSPFQKHVKVAEAKVSEEMEAGQRALLQRLFPDVAVEGTAFPVWVDQFEAQAQLTIEDTKNQVRVCTYIVRLCRTHNTCTSLQLCVLKERVEEMEQSEQSYIQEAEGFRETLNITVNLI